MILNKIYRKIFEKCENLASHLRITHLRIRYPKLTINYGSYISANCIIMCSDDSELILENVRVASGVILSTDMGGTLHIRNTYIGFNSVIVARNNIEIKDYCEIAEMVVIRDQDHQFGEGKLLRESGMKSAPIKIGKNVWIGAKATILKGISIGDNAVVGANAVVTKDIAENTLAIGVPARNPRLIIEK